MMKWPTFFKTGSALLLLLSFCSLTFAAQDHSWQEKVRSCNYQIYELKQSYRYTPNNQNASALAECLMAYSMERIDLRDFTGAENRVAEARDIFPTSPGLIAAHSKVIIAQGEPERAADLILDSIDEIGREPNLIAILADIRYKQGDLEEAKTLYQEIVKKAPQNGQWKEKLATISGENQVEQKMRKRISNHFRMQFDTGVAHHLSGDIMRVLEDAYSNIGLKFNLYPQEPVTVLIYNKQDFRSVTSSPDWAGGLYDGKIRIPLGGVTEITDQLKAIIYHEYTHVLVRIMGGSRVPQWLNEGLAQVSEKSIHNFSIALTKKAVRNNKLLPFKKISTSWRNMANGEVALAYNQSYTLIDFLENNFGEHATVQLLERIGLGISIRKAFLNLYGYDGPEEAFAALQEELK